jgi:hypothetical protein
MTRRSGCLIAPARVARKIPFIGRLTRAYLNFEVKDRDGTELGFCRDRHFELS